ncbi:MAG: hypothetical protein WBW31_19700, partial [Candidatus Sulfotelmatobacter sp.]
MGHVVRCLWLANALREKYSDSISFCMNQDDVGIAVVKRRDWPVVHAALGQLGGANADALIIDLPSGVSAEAVRSFHQENPRTAVVLIDTNCTGTIEADLVVNPLE